MLALALLLAGPAAADQNAPGLEALFAELGRARDASEAAPVEAEIWRLWMDSGSGALDRRMRRGVLALRAGRAAEAIEEFSAVIAQRPDFAEAWNKRATAYYLAGDPEASMLDIERTLALEPRHFGAISGMGLIFLERGDERAALRAFEQVLRIHPRAPGARRQVERLRARHERPA